MIRVIDNRTTADRGPRLLYPQGQPGLQAQQEDPVTGLPERLPRRGHLLRHRQDLQQ
jgi:hypothetical protein